MQPNHDEFDEYLRQIANGTINESVVASRDAKSSRVLGVTQEVGLTANMHDMQAANSPASVKPEKTALPPRIPYAVATTEVMPLATSIASVATALPASRRNDQSNAVVPGQKTKRIPATAAIRELPSPNFDVAAAVTVVPANYQIDHGVSAPPRPRPRQTRPSLPASSWTLHDQQNDLATLLTKNLGKAKGAILARDLMNYFGSFPAVLSASSYRLSKFDGMTKNLVELLHASLFLAEKLAMERIPQIKPILDSFPLLLEYLHLNLAYRPIEHFRVLYLDKRGRLILDDLQSTGTNDHVPVYPREVIKRGLEVNASGLLMVHNHPSGDPQPSSADVRMTREISDAGKPLGLTVHDHLIVGQNGYTSLRALKLF